MSLTKNVILMAEYNQWMNQSMYHAASQLDKASLEKNMGAFFGSILGTLNHILVGDTIWLTRFAQHSQLFKSLDYVKTLSLPNSLDDILHRDFEQLMEERIKFDQMIIDFSKEIREETLDTTLTYTNTKSVTYHKNFWQILLHFFNHQTHHRGQVSTLLSQVGIDIGATDLLLKIPEVDATE